MSDAAAPAAAPTPDGAGTAPSARLGRVLDAVIARYASGVHEAEVVAAREAWL